MIKPTYNPFKEDRLIYAAATPAGAAGGTEDEDEEKKKAEEEKKKKKAVKKAPAPKLDDFNPAEAAKFRDSGIEELNQLKSTVEPLADSGGKSEYLISEIDESVGRISEYGYYTRYLGRALERTEKNGEWWLIPDSERAAELHAFQQELSEVGAALGTSGSKRSRIDHATTRKQAVDIIKDLIAESKSKREKEEKKILDKTDSTIMKELSIVRKKFASAPNKKEQLEKELGLIMETLAILRKIQGKSKAERARILKEMTGSNEYISLDTPSEVVGELATTISDQSMLNADLAELKAFLLSAGIKSGDTDRLKEVLGRVLNKVLTNKNTKDGRKKSIRHAIQDLKEIPSTTDELKEFIIKNRHLIFPEDKAYGIQTKMSRGEAHAIKEEADYSNDIKMRRTILSRIKGYQGYGEEIEQDQIMSEKVSVEDLRAKFNELEQSRAAKIDQYTTVIKSKTSTLKSRIKNDLIPLVEEKFAAEEKQKMLQQHKDGFAAALKSLDGWEDFEINLFEKPMYGDGLDVNKLIDADGNLNVPEGKQLGIKDYLDIADNARANDQTKKNALLTADDMLKGMKENMETPSVTVEVELPEYEKEMDRFVDAMNDEMKEISGYKIRWMSLYDFKHMGEKLVEWAKRKYTRRSDDLLGDIGSKLFSGLPGPLKTASNEFDRLKEQSELDEVEQYKQSYSNKDAWQIMDVMHKTRNQDEMKACMFLLADLGRIRWDDPQLWRQLMYFGHSAITFDFDDPESEILNQGKLHMKLQRIVGVIWDFDTFQGWATTNESNYSSKMESHKDFCDKNAEMAKNLDDILGMELAAYKKAKKEGRVAKIDPQRFEKMIHYNLEFGKGCPEGKIYFLIQGIACGLLPYEAASRLNSKWINQFPLVDIFGSETERGAKPTVTDIKEWAKLDWDLNRPGSAFKKWFYTYGLHKPRVYQRVDKALTQGLGQDHDDATAWFGVMNVTTAKTILSQNAQGFRMPATGFQNASIGMLHYLDNLMEFGPEDMDNDGETGFMSQLTRFAGSFSVFDGITSGKMYKDKDNYFKFNGEQYNEPRYGEAFTEDYGRGKVKGRTTQDFMDETKKYLKYLDPEFFDYLFNEIHKKGDAGVKEMVARMQKKYNNPNIFGETKNPPQTVDQMFDAVREFTRSILATKQGQENVKKMRQAVLDDHREMERQLLDNDRNFRTVRQRLADAEKVDLSAYSLKTPTRFSGADDSPIPKEE